jgi:ABC-type branched-subunit amino acid transport system ATPase component/branched-subunit amino acid ABC-type transport system permease component
VAEFAGYLLSGLVAGALYALMASGLVLSYSASGVFNFAHGAIGFLCALLFFELHTGLGWPLIPAAVVTIGLVAPALGYLLHRLMFNRLARAGETAQIVATIGLTVALPALGVWIVERLVNQFDADLPLVDNQFAVPGLGPDPVVHWRAFGSVPIDSDQLATFTAAALCAVALWLLLRRTRLGLGMRATVDVRTLASLRGIDPDTSSAAAWMVSAMLAGLTGVLAAPLLGLDPSAFTMLLLISATAAVFGRLSSIPVTFAAGLGLGVAQNLVAAYSDFARDITGYRTAAPVVLLFLGLLVLGHARARRGASIAEDPPPPDHLADLPPWRRRLPWAVASVLLLGYIYTVASPFWAGLAAQGLAFGLIFLSFVVVTGIGGMVNLAQATFVTAAGLTAGLLVHQGLPAALALLAGVAAATVLGVVVALPALRLGGRVLALATLALALVCDSVLFQIPALSNGTMGWQLPGLALGPIDLRDPRAMVAFLLAVVGLVVLMIRNLERSGSGRAIFAVRSAPAAALTSGISVTRTKLALFAVSAAIAGLGGVLLATFNTRMTAGDFPALAGFVWLAIVVVQGVRRPGAAVVSGLLVAVLPHVLAYVTDSQHVLAILFGLGGVVLAQNPDGVLAQVAERRHRHRQRRRARAGADAQAPPIAVETLEPPIAQVEVAADGDAAAFRLEAIRAGYDGMTVLRGIDLSVRAGTVVALLGANGAGKTTACSVAAGVLSPTAGRVWLEGVEVTGWAPHRRVHAGLFSAPQGRGIFPNLSVEENLAAWLRSEPEREQVYERFEILGKRRKLTAGVLSGGEQQILALAPALVRPPKVLIADEPSLGLAPRIVDEIFQFFSELAGRGVALVVVEEKAREVLSIADSVAFMRLGRIAWTGPRADVDESRLTDAYLGISAEPLRERAVEA